MRRRGFGGGVDANLNRAFQPFDALAKLRHLLLQRGQFFLLKIELAAQAQNFLFLMPYEGLQLNHHVVHGRCISAMMCRFKQARQRMILCLHCRSDARI